MKVAYRLTDEYGDTHENETEISENVSEFTALFVAKGLLFEDGWVNDHGSDYDEIVMIVDGKEIPL